MERKIENDWLSGRKEMEKKCFHIVLQQWRLSVRKKTMMNFLKD